MPNGLLLLAAVAIYCLIVYGPRFIGRKRKIIGRPIRFNPTPKLTIRDPELIKRIRSLDNSETLREVNARRGYE